MEFITKPLKLNEGNNEIVKFSSFRTARVENKAKSHHPIECLRRSMSLDMFELHVENSICQGKGKLKTCLLPPAVRFTIWLVDQVPLR